MDSRPVVFEISSDEECWGGETRRGGGSGGGDSDDGCDWISALFERESDDSDDVVLVGEVVLNPKPRPKSSVEDFDDDGDGDGDDDDCVVLDGDPDKPVAIENNSVCDSDDLLIVGERGQIACRDYPHPRHLCAKFPFTSTPHESHCHLCHCYVCDSLAPCVQWGCATSSIDHCHATDKHEYWKLQRRNLKQGDKVPLPVPKLPDTFVSTGPVQTIPPLPPPLPPPLQPKYLAHHQVSRPTTIRACSTPVNPGFPNTTNQGRSQQSSHVLSRNKFPPHWVPQQLPTTDNNIIARGRSQSVGNLGPQFSNSHAIFKRAGSAGVALTTNRSRYSSSYNNHATQYIRNPPPMAASNDRNLTRRQDFSSGITSGSYARQAPSLQNTGSRFGNSVPSHHQVSSHPNKRSVLENSVPSPPVVSSHSNISSSFIDSVPYPQASSQPNTGSNFEHSVPSQLQAISRPSVASSYVDTLPSSQSNMGGNFEDSVPYQPQVSSQPSIGSSFVDMVPSPQASSQPTVESSFENSVPSQLQVSQPDTSSSFVHPVPSQPQVYRRRPFPVSNDSHYGVHQGNEAQDALDPSFPDFNTSCVARTGQSDQQSLAENSQVQSAGPTYHPSFVSDIDPHIPATTNVGSPDFQFDSWMLENQSVSRALEAPVPCGLNMYSPEPAPDDSGFFFDFESLEDV